MNILDFLVESEDFFIKKYVGTFNLNEFLNNSINKLGHIDMLFIDLSALGDTKEKMIEIVSAFTKYQNVKLGFYMEEINMEIINDLISLNIFDIVSKIEVKELKEELKMVFSAGMSESYIKEKFNLSLTIESKPIYNFKEKEMVISVAGALHRIGTTTIALGFAMYLKSLGANVCYVEANKSGHLEFIANYYKMKSNNQLFSYKNFKLQKIGINNHKKFDVIIYDLGILKDKVVEGMEYSDLSILVSGDKATEIKYLREAKEQLVEQNYNTIINFSKGENKENVYYLNPVMDLFSFEENVDVYNKMIEKYFRETKKI